MIDIAVLLVLGFASFRITRALLFDTWIEGTRQRFYVWLVNRQRFKIVFTKIIDGTSCSWCAGWWVSLTLLAFYLKAWPWEFSINNWISAFAVTGVQGLLHAFEPDAE